MLIDCFDAVQSGLDPVARCQWRDSAEAKGPRPSRGLLRHDATDTWIAREALAGIRLPNEGERYDGAGTYTS